MQPSNNMNTHLQQYIYNLQRGQHDHRASPTHNLHVQGMQPSNNHNILTQLKHILHTKMTTFKHTHKHNLRACFDCNTHNTTQPSNTCITSSNAKKTFSVTHTTFTQQNECATHFKYNLQITNTTSNWNNKSLYEFGHNLRCNIYIIQHTTYIAQRK